jgi:putative ABC transport system substrate-binding protein
MDRRAFLGMLAGGLLAAPLAAEGQHPGRVPRVGYLVLGDSSNPVTSSVRNLFKEALRDEGYIEAQDVEIVDRYEADFAGLRNAAKDLVRLNVDVIVAGGTAGGLAARQATSTIPIVAGSLADPVADGLAASLARPGGNITGNTFLAPQLGPKRLQLLQEVVPRIKRLAALQHPRVYSELTMRTMATELDEIAKASGIERRRICSYGPGKSERTCCLSQSDVLSALSAAR